MSHPSSPRSLEDELRIKSSEVDKLKADYALMETVQQRAEGRLAAMRRTIADLNERLDEVASASSKTHESEKSELLNRISVLESTLLQREEEIEQTRQELEERKSESATHDAAMDAIRTKLEDTNAWVFKLAGERRSAELALQTVKAQRDRVERENATLVAERKAAVETVLQLKERVERDAREKADILQELDALGNAHADLLREIGRLQADYSAATATISERDGAIEELQSQNRKQGQEMRVQHDMLSWLQLVAIEIRRSRRWWFLVSKNKRGELLSRRLAQIGLFDAQSYLERYPDVLEEGIDPLVHYLVHGMREGRQR